MITNITPASIYGPYTHALFLGCSVISFDSTLGQGSQVSEISVQLVEDTAPSIAGKRYFLGDLTESLWYNADPGFIGLTHDIIGCPAYFCLGDFEFSGIIQSWEHKYSDGGNIYSVKLVDPRLILEGTQLIIGDYTGATNGVINLFNLYGLLEYCGEAVPPISLVDGEYVEGNLGPDGAGFGSLSGGFGGSSSTKNGIPWPTLRKGLQLMMCAFPIMPANDFCAYGRIVYKGLSDALMVTTCGLILADWSTNSTYVLDIDELPNIPTLWSFNTNNISVLDLITQVCELTNYDFYIELVFVKDTGHVASSDGVVKFIKVRTIARNIVNSSYLIDSYINSATVPINSYSSGQELRTSPTSTFIIGGQKNTIYQVDDIYGNTATYGGANILEPFMGFKHQEIYNLPPAIVMPVWNENNRWWEFDIPTDNLIRSLKGVLTTTRTTIKITELELQAALSGYDSWLFIAETLDSDSYKIIAIDSGLPEACSTTKTLKKLVELINEYEAKRIAAGANKDLLNIAIRDFRTKYESAFFHPATTNASYAKLDDDLQSLFNFIGSFASEYFGRKYMVKLPYSYFKSDPLTGEITYTDLPCSEGYSEQTTVLGLPTVGDDAMYMDIFKTDDGRIKSFVRIDGIQISGYGVPTGVAGHATGFPTFDARGMDPNSYVVYNSGLYVGCTVEEGIVFEDPTGLTGPRAVISLGQPIKYYQDDAIPECINMLIKALEVAYPSGSGTSSLMDLKNVVNKTFSGVASKNMFGQLLAPYLIPNAAAIGIKNNLMNYGPWGYLGAPGAISLKVDENLVPWNYGSIDGLNSVASGLAYESLSISQSLGIGSITSPGYPTFGLGAELGSTHIPLASRTANSETVTVGTLSSSVYHTSLTPWTGTYGPNITSISTTFSAQGVQTTYQMRTFTPKFGTMAKYNADRFNKMATLSQKIGKFDRGQRRFDARKIELSSLNTDFKRMYNYEDSIKKEGVVQGGKSPHEVWVGESLSIIVSGTGGLTTGTRNIIASMPIYEIPAEQLNYGNKSMMSFDGLLSPVSVGGDGNLPRFADITSSTGVITVDDLNPFQYGHNIDILANGSSLSGDDNINAQGRALDYRFMALRGPLVIHGWGYDTDNKPIPNSVDTLANISNGIFATGDLTENFHPNYLQNSKLWPVGPLDAKWDRARGVWVAGGTSTPAEDIDGMAFLLEDLSAGYTALAEKLHYVDNEGWIPDGTIITVWDRVMQNGNISAGATIRYRTSNGKNWCDGGSCINMQGISF
jgi:hypothetical protein